jgi:lipid II:glycine glycyltransferase (peptidoglycan interpeptide bridge formation enzyme)
MADKSKTRLTCEITDSFDTLAWNELVRQLPHYSILQSWQWGEIKSRHGWQPSYLVWKLDGKVQAAALALVREQKIIPFLPAARIMYIPHGPLLDWRDEDHRENVLEDLKSFGRDKRVIFIKIDPQVIKKIGINENPDREEITDGIHVCPFLEESGWVESGQQIQFKNTFLIDLRESEEEILSRMKQKTRYNIRLAGRKGVAVRLMDEKELDLLYEMYATTSLRDGFIIRPKEYYLDIWKTMMRANMASPLVADVDGMPVSGLILFHFHQRSYYFYGMSIEDHREKMPNHLLQWEAIKRSKALGCLNYDLWGAPDSFDESDRMWGVYKFKEGFGGQVFLSIGAYDYAVSQVKYKMFSIILPRIQDFLRKNRFRQIRQEIE